MNSSQTDVIHQRVRSFVRSFVFARPRIDARRMQRASASVASLRRALAIGARSSSRRLRRVVVVVVGGASSSQTPRAMSTTTPNAGALHATFERAVEASKNEGEQSWLERLDPDPETEKHAPNRTSREVRSGHYVRVTPERLENPRLVLASESCASAIGFELDVNNPGNLFLRYFSGDCEGVDGLGTWATPYALSIMGSRMTSNCPFGNGNGYGDGRAISIGEMVNPVTGVRHEMQLKGGGRTPFCRGADGRAVLRSSIREFLASEAMHALGVDTTRALSLIESVNGTTARRPWYSPTSDEEYAKRLPTVDDPRLKEYPPEQRVEIVEMLKAQKRDPDIMIQEPCAITTRVAPSFMRIGHVDLFSRRATSPRATDLQKEQLRKIVKHAAFREFPETIEEHGEDMAKVTRAMLEKSGAKIAKMVAGWIRVGFCQGNFNADNCLIGGRTMDYGPFGFMDKYDPGFAKWTGSGDHFAFMAQPKAGLTNFAVLAISCAPLLAGGSDEATAIVTQMESVFEDEVNDALRTKLGFATRDSLDVAESLFRDENGLEALMYQDQADWTVTWRRLADTLEVEYADDDALLEPLMTKCFYGQGCKGLSADRKKKWAAFVRRWRSALEASGTSLSNAADRMRAANPKYILREHLLVDAYTKAAAGDYSMVQELYQLTQNPYGGDGDTQAFDEKYFVKAPEDALTSGGVAFMS